MTRIRWIVLALLVLYVGSYLAVRAGSVEVWARDGRPYFIVPSSSRWLYYFYRPVMYLDGAVTGMRFHIGPHRDAAAETPQAQSSSRALLSPRRSVGAS